MGSVTRNLKLWPQEVGMYDTNELVLATVADMCEVSTLESSSFPSDEAASDQTIRERQQVAGKYFLVMKGTNSSEVIGFVNGTCIEGETITHESMTDHNPDGKTLVIHSVTVSSRHRKEGCGTRLLKKYVEYVTDCCPEIHLILLLSKAYLLRFYVSCGFQLVCLSPVHHGKERWFEMKIDLTDERSTTEQYQVNAFSDRPFSGNPAAVVFKHRHPSSMQGIAMENNLSETAFIQLRPGTLADFDIRWFTPTSEVDLCGHATLASAHALYQSGRVASEVTINFVTKNGDTLTAKKRRDGMIELDFPSTPPEAVTLTETELDGILKGLTIKKENILYTGKTVYDFFIEIDSREFAGLQTIHFESLSRLETRGVIITCRGTSANHDFSSRWFGPRCGINEDPVTGSAHCALAPYWFDKFHSNAKEGEIVKTALTGYQASARGGEVGVSMTDRGKRVLLSGYCATIMISKLLL